VHPQAIVRVGRENPGHSRRHRYDGTRRRGSPAADRINPTGIKPNARCNATGRRQRIRKAPARAPADRVRPLGHRRLPGARTKITAEEFNHAYKREIQSIAQKFGRQLTPEQALANGIWKIAIDRLTANAAMDIHARELGVTASDRIVSAIIQTQHPEIFDADGRIDVDKYYKVIRQAGFRSVGEYEQARRQALWREQLMETLGANLVPQKYLLETLYRFRDETRVIEYIVPDFTKRIAVADPDDDQQQKFYESNKGRYMALEERHASLLLLPREEILSRTKVTDEEVKAAYEAAKESYNVPEKRRVAQLVFADKAAAEKAYAELSKAKDFNAAAEKLGYPPADIDLGLLTRAEMIDPKIAEAAFNLKPNTVSPPVEGLSVVLLRVSEIEPGKKRTLGEVKGEIGEHLATERGGKLASDLYEKVENLRAKSKGLKDIAAELKVPFQEIAIDRTGKAADGKEAIAHADRAKIAEALFNATEGVETEALELSDGGFAWFELGTVTPERQRPFEEVKAKVKADYILTERAKEMASRADKLVERLKGGEGFDAVARSLGAKVQRTPAVRRIVSPPPAGLTAFALQEAFRLPKGGAASAATADGKSRVIFRVAEVTPAPDPKAEQLDALKEDVAKQMRIDIGHQYIEGLRARYGVSTDRKALEKALGVASETETN
jgi:peptidyl-prolyl cis-trans isomerase D